jgi:hypothetical protein
MTDSLPILVADTQGNVLMIWMLIGVHVLRAGMAMFQDSTLLIPRPDTFEKAKSKY